MNNKIFILLIFLVLIIVGISGCNTSPDETKQKQEMNKTFQPIIQAMSPLADQYMDDNTRIENNGNNGNYYDVMVGNFKYWNNDSKWMYFSTVSQPVFGDKQKIPGNWVNVPSETGPTKYAYKHPEIKGKVLLFKYENGVLDPIPLNNEIQATTPNETITVFIIYSSETSKTSYVSSSDRYKKDAKTVASGQNLYAMIEIFYWPEKQFMGDYGVSEEARGSVTTRGSSSSSSSTDHTDPIDLVKDLIIKYNSTPSVYDDFGEYTYL